MLIIVSLVSLHRSLDRCRAGTNGFLFGLRTLKTKSKLPSPGIFKYRHWYGNFADTIFYCESKTIRSQVSVLLPPFTGGLFVPHFSFNLFWELNRIKGQYLTMMDFFMVAVLVIEKLMFIIVKVILSLFIFIPNDEHCTFKRFFCIQKFLWWTELDRRFYKSISF